MAKADTADLAELPESGDAPLIDLNDASIKKLLARAKKRGYITYDELNAGLPQDQMSSEQIEDVMSAINEMGVNIVENDEAPDDDEEAEPEEEIEAVDQTAEPGDGNVAESKKVTVDRTDDPVRMYLREMGAVELLSREGEIAIAKRIEAGRDTMILGLCESPITFNAIIDWSTALNEGTMQLREILDLDAMLSKDPAPESLTEDDDDSANGEISEKTAGPTFKEEDDVVEAAIVEEDDEEEGLTERRAKAVADDDDEDNTLSLAQMEETLKPMALEKFASITSIYRKFSKIQAARMEALSFGNDFGAGDEKKYQKLREELTTAASPRLAARCCALPSVTKCRARRSSIVTWARSLMRIGSSQPSRPIKNGQHLPRMKLTPLSAFAQKSLRSRRTPACHLANSAASLTWCKRANAKPGLRRRKWLKPISVSLSRLLKNIRTAACNSLILFRKAISA
jgi:RNA polymerase primary sigma factor